MRSDDLLQGPTSDVAGKNHVLMSYNKVVCDEIQEPVQHKVAAAARSVTEQLTRHPFLKRMIEIIDYFRHYLRQTIHRYTPLPLQRYNFFLKYASFWQ